ncbi:MAG: sensor histidine kinase [Peptostreptococcaceae bacterium]
MDINSKENNLLSFVNKFEKAKRIIYIVLAIIAVVMMVVIKNKIEGVMIILIGITLILIIKNLANDFQDMMIFELIHDITNSSEDIVDIFIRTKEADEIEPILSKSHKNILKELYKIEKHIHNSTLKTIQSENLSNELIVEVSKSLKTPVNNIGAFICQLTDRKNSSKDLNVIEKIEIETSQLKHSIEELFELSKVVTGSIDLDIQKIDIKNLLKQSLVEYEEKFNESNLTLKTNLIEDKILVNCDGQQMWRVFEILLENITLYSKENSRVYCEVFKKEEQVAINLINISKEELNIDINEFMKRIKEDSKVKKMGLAIASNLVKIQKGQFDITIDGDMFNVQLKFDSNETTN